MKRFLFYTTLILSLMLASCEQVDKLTQFDKDYSIDTSIPSAIGINLPFDLPTPAIKTDISEDLEVNNSRVDLIESARLKTLKAQISSPENGSFDFLKEIEVYLSAEDLPKILVAYKRGITDSGEKTINLDIVEEQNLRDYLQKEKLSFDIRVTTDQLLFHETELKINTSLAIDAKILGI